MNLRIFIIITIFILLIFFSGCINNKNDNEKNNDYIKSYEFSDLKLTLEIDNKTLNDGINLTIKLMNIKDYPIRIYKYFHLGLHFLDLYLIGPNNTTLDIFLGAPQILGEIVILYPNQYLIENITLKNEDITYLVPDQNESLIRIDWEWKQKGKYVTWAIYREEIKSNVIEFEIK